MKEINISDYDGENLVLKNKEDIKEVVELIKNEENFIVTDDCDCSEFLTGAALNSRLINGNIRIYTGEEEY